MLYRNLGTSSDSSSAADRAAESPERWYLTTIETCLLNDFLYVFLDEDDTLIHLVETGSWGDSVVSLSWKT